MCPTATPAAVRKQIAGGTLDPIYLLLGEDEIEKSALAHEFVQASTRGCAPSTSSACTRGT